MEAERVKIRLPELADALQQTDVRRGYVDLGTGRIVSLAGEMDEEETMEHIFSVEEDWERYVMLPDISEEEEKNAMRRFAELQQEPEIRERMRAALSGVRSRARFRRLVEEFHLRGKWKSFLRLHFLSVAREWCGENGIVYEN